MTEKSYAELLKEGEAYLSEHGITESRLDAWYLFEECFAMDRATYFVKAQTGIPVTEQNRITRFLEMLEERGDHVPLQQVLGVQEFMGLSFDVDDHVLIPRQDTETLVELVLEDIEKEGEKSLHILDLCTGSGCIGISLAHYLSKRNVEIMLSDISMEALRIAGENIKKNHVEDSCSVVSSDMFERVGTYDIIVSNPPYIPTGEIETLESEVKDHEPRLALDGDEDGLKYYRIIASEASKHLTEKGRIYVEIGYDQGPAVKKLFEENGFCSVEVKKDLPGKDRIVRAYKQKK